MPLLTRLRQRLSEQDGFTMIVVLGVLMVISLLSVGAYAAVNSDQRTSGYNNDQKEAYAAAEAGLDWYLAQLRTDSNYWTRCTSVPNISGNPAPVSDPYWGTGADPRAGKWRSIPGSKGQYVVELLPAPAASFTPPSSAPTACSTADPSGTMIDKRTGTMTIRVDGKAGTVKRSIVATLRRKGFLDYLYLSEFETTAPLLYTTAADQTRAAAGCAKPYASRSAADKGWCTTIQFAPQDSVAGPFHSADSICVKNSPTFGRVDSNNKPLGDALELEPTTAAPAVRDCGSASPKWNGTLVTTADPISLPPDNSALAANVTPNYMFQGKTWIQLNSDGTMLVTNKTMGFWKKSMSQPTNGVIYVDNASCGTNYDVNNPYGDDEGCGDAYVWGTYTQNLTIGAAKDVVVADDLLKSSTNDVLMGLIANGFVRVYHKVATCGGSETTPNWNPTSPNPPEPGYNQNIEIDAAILALNNSFLVDQWACGNQLGTLTVKGAIAQNYRGPVGTSGATGYIKNYQYDDRFRFRAPPRFLDPTKAGWNVIRQVEQSPGL
jgi:type II secretory pathway pseudopilin PulG